MKAWELADKLGVPRSLPLETLYQIAGAANQAWAERTLALARGERDRTALATVQRGARLSRQDCRSLAEKRNDLQRELEQQRLARRAAFRATGRLPQS
jgi:hypothetical protein